MIRFRGHKDLNENCLPFKARIVSAMKSIRVNSLPNFGNRDTEYFQEAFEYADEFNFRNM